MNKSIAFSENMVYMNKPFVTTLFLSVTSLVSAYSQDTTLSAKPLSATPFNKWEVGIDLLPLIDKQKDAFGYIIKRNYQLTRGRSAIRFRLLPRIENSPLAQGSLNSTRINFAIGYERQHLIGRFAYLYGVEPTLLYFISKTESDLKGLITRFREYGLGADGFVGGRFYMSNHLSLTLETHLVLRHYDAKIIDKSSNLDQAGTTTNQLLFNPINTLFISYHF